MAAFRASVFAAWEGLGLAVQAYQKRALPVLNWLIDLSRAQGNRIPVRLVKGAYWDSESKRAQQLGLPGYPVYTRKGSTDVSYLACAKRMIDARDAIFPQFATHNAHSVAAILEVAGRRRDFEFQRLHGKGEALYHEVLHRADTQLPCRVYAPVGSHEDLLPYLVRRLLENGANTSFVHRLEDERTPIDVLVADPVAEIDARVLKPHPRIPLPRFIYPDRRNSAGLNLADRTALETLDAEMETVAATVWHAAPCVAGHITHGDARPVYDPSDRRREIGTVIAADAVTVERAVASASEAAAEWDRRGANERAAILERAADLFEEHRAELMTLCVREGGKPVVDALAELREAVDFCRYYATAARRDFATPHVLPGPTGEHNELQRHGRGVFACISPWNFPLAIFTGLIAAALVAGNAVIGDSSALPEQVAKDALRSGFNSAGQRCSALRVLYLQEEIAPKVIEMLCGAMAELRVGDPVLLATDVGPVIDEAARAALEERATRMTQEARLLCAVPLPADTTHGSFFAPCVFEIDTLAQLPGEVFGPVLHVIRYAARDLDRVIDEINGTGYGLTLGVHSRVEGSARYIQSRVRAGNCYVNRDVIGAVVGVQPFGGEGLSGTGPKAGGLVYLLRFSVERTLAVNIAAVGGNTSLLSLQED